MHCCSVKLEGTIVCVNARIQEKSNLKDCIIGAHVVIPEESNILVVENVTL